MVLQEIVDLNLRRVRWMEELENRHTSLTGSKTERTAQTQLFQVWNGAWTGLMMMAFLLSCRFGGRDWFRICGSYLRSEDAVSYSMSYFSVGYYNVKLKRFKCAFVSCNNALGDFDNESFST